VIATGYELTVLFQFSGLVTELKDVHVTQVSLGKAHAVALTNKGQVYTFGINNKGQCGRDFASQVKEGIVHMNVIYVGESKIVKNFTSQFNLDRLGTALSFFTLFFDLPYTVCACSPS
jgi:alpha-tubulin suppressor-like RCC1 family protein